MNFKKNDWGRIFLKGMANLPEVFLLTLITAVVVALTAAVVFRYFIGSSLSWIEETSRILLVWISFIGGAVALKRKEHIAVQYFVSFFPKRLIYFIVIIHHLIIIFFSAFLSWLGILFTKQMSFSLLPAMQVSTAWMYSGLPVACALMILYSVIHLVNLLRNPDQETLIRAGD